MDNWCFQFKMSFQVFRGGMPPSWTQVKATSCMNGELTLTWKQPSVKSKNNHTIYFTFRLSWQWHPECQSTSLRSSNCLSSSFLDDFLLVFHISSISTITIICGSCIDNRQCRPIQCDLCWLVKSGSWAELVVYTLCTFLATCRWKRLQDCRRFQIRIM